MISKRKAAESQEDGIKTEIGEQNREQYLGEGFVEKVWQNQISFQKDSETLAQKDVVGPEILSV